MPGQGPRSRGLPSSSFVVRVGPGPPAPSAGGLQTSGHLWYSGKGLVHPEEGGDKEEGRPLTHLPVSRSLAPPLPPVGHSPAASQESTPGEKWAFQAAGISDKPFPRCVILGK